MKFGQGKLSRRRLLGGAAGASAALGLHEVVPHQGLHHAVGTAFAQDGHGGGHDVHGGGATMKHPLHAGAVGMVDPRTNGFDPQAILRDFDEGSGRERRARVGAGRRGEDDRGGAGRAVRRLDLQRPRARARRCAPARASGCGSGSSTARSTRTRSTSTASTRRAMDGIPGIGAGDIAPGESHHLRVRRHARSACTSTTATRCRWPSTSPRASTARSSSTRRPGRPEADELVMVMNGFDTNFDRANEVYAVNTVAFAYMHRPVVVKRDELVRIYLVNALEFDLAQLVPHPRQLLRLLPDRHAPGAARLHRHGDPGPGRARHPRAALPVHRQVHVPRPRQSEFAELGWMGFFEVTD